jgi:hypothetical protein
MKFGRSLMEVLDECVSLANMFADATALLIDMGCFWIHARWPQ